MVRFHNDGDDGDEKDVPDPVTHPKDIGDDIGEKIGEHKADEGNV